MLLKFIISAFKMEEDSKEISKNNRYPDAAGHASSSNHKNKGTAVIVGLKILVHISSQGESNNNFVVKPALLGSTTRSASGRPSSPPPSSSSAAASDYYQYSCYLKSCHLCNKKLSLDKDVYMYRGDQGFCSVECRERQIYLDEMKELEASTKQILKSNSNNYRHCNNKNGGADRRETRIILEELRRERYHHHHQQNKDQFSQKIHWAIIS